MLSERDPLHVIDFVEQEDPVVVGVLPEACNLLDQAGRTRPPERHEMHFPMGNVGAPQIALLERVLHIEPEAGHPGEVVVGEVRNPEPDRLCLQQRSDVLELGKIVVAELGNPISATWFVDHDPLVLQLLEGFAHRHRTDPTVLGDVFDAHLGSRWEFAGHHQLAKVQQDHLLHGRLDHRRRGRGEGGALSHQAEPKTGDQILQILDIHSVWM